ncbi:MAG TPA: methylated-DNA--[protein]-cysteine S-methyltransferase [Candidatus Binatia bacterium]|jgi:O-6-methylguanine DNA methyltransferase
MTTSDIDERLRALLQSGELPHRRAERVAADVRRRAARASRTATLRFDLTASSRGIARLRLGRGLTVAEGSGARAVADEAREQLRQYLAGERAFFDVPVDLAAVPPFQRAVLRSAAAIPFGTVRPYAWVAARAGNARAVRAAGTALGHNPVPLLVPCHRVVRSDGALGNYIFGPSLKERLLGLEHATPLYVGCTSTRIVCLHGCPHERRIGPDRRVVFASVAEARSVGYRRCKVCTRRAAAAGRNR